MWSSSRVGATVGETMLAIARACSLAAALLLSSAPAHLPACASEQGVAIFEAKCTACHEGGKNVLQPGKTLFPSALEANGYATESAIIELLRNGKGQMPKYQGSIPSTSKLTDEELAEVAQYVQQRAAPQRGNHHVRRWVALCGELHFMGSASRGRCDLHQRLRV